MRLHQKEALLRVILMELEKCFENGRYAISIKGIFIRITGKSDHDDIEESLVSLFGDTSYDNFPRTRIGLMNRIMTVEKAILYAQARLSIMWATIILAIFAAGLLISQL